MSLVKFKSKNHPQQISCRGALDAVDDRGTDPVLFAELDARFHFTIDVAASATNAKCERYYDLESDGLVSSWSGERVWCNPPYSDLMGWVRKAWDEWWLDSTDLIVMLVPANRPEQNWWQDHIEPYRDNGGDLRTEYLRGRRRFVNAGKDGIGPNERPPYGVALLIWQEVR